MNTGSVAFVVCYSLIYTQHVTVTRAESLTHHPHDRHVCSLCESIYIYIRQLFSFCSGVTEKFVVMGSGTADLGNCFPTFRKHCLVSISREAITHYRGVTYYKNEHLTIHSIFIRSYSIQTVIS